MSQPEKIDELRRLLDLRDRDVVSIVRTGDVALVFVGPQDKWDAVMHHSENT